MPSEEKLPVITSIDSYRVADREPTEEELREIEELGLDNPADYDDLPDDFYLGNQLYTDKYDVLED